MSLFMRMMLIVFACTSFALQGVAGLSAIVMLHDTN